MIYLQALGYKMVLQMMVHQLEICKAQVKVQIQGQAHTQQQGQVQQAAQTQAQEAQVQAQQEVQAEVEAQVQQEVQVEEQAQQAAQAEAQEKQSSVQYQLGSHQQQLQQDLQGLAPSASHTWPNLGPIQVEPSSLAPPHQPREELPQPEAELKPPSLRAPAEWSGQQTQVQPQQHPQPQICSPSSAMVSPVGGCPYPPCRLYCLEGHSRSEQRQTSTETSSAVAEGAAPDGSWRSRFHSP